LGHGRRTSERWGRRHRPISCAISEPSRSPMATTGSVPLLPAVITAAIDLCGTVTAHAARALGVPDAPITTIAAQVDGITPTNGANAAEKARSPDCDRPTPGAHRRKLPGQANPHRGRDPGRPAREGQDRHRPPGKPACSSHPSLSRVRQRFEMISNLNCEINYPSLSLSTMPGYTAPCRSRLVDPQNRRLVAVALQFRNSPLLR
jgi:hypothetical protein